MKLEATIGALLLSRLSTSCGHGSTHGDDGWSSEELAELEAKWGTEVAVLCAIADHAGLM